MAQIVCFLYGHIGYTNIMYSLVNTDKK